MRKKLKKVAAIALSCLMAAGVMTGCGSSKAGIGTKTNDGNKVLFQYDGEKVTLKEGWLYAKLIAAQYESTYSSTYGKWTWGGIIKERSRHLKVTQNSRLFHS